VFFLIRYRKEKGLNEYEEKRKNMLKGTYEEMNVSETKKSMAFFNMLIEKSYFVNAQLASWTILPIISAISARITI
jgi:hypothetical protein